MEGLDIFGGRVVEGRGVGFSLVLLDLTCA